MEIYSTSLKEVLVVEPIVFKDIRGFFMETYQREKYEKAGISGIFVQDNHSHSQRGTLRGLHYQLNNSQAKLIYVVRGEIFDVAVDIRRDSPTFGKWAGINISSDNHRQLYIPEGFAHGFYVLSNEVDVIYKCTDFYHPEDEYGIRWDDKELAINWPGQNPILSQKDAAYPFLAQQSNDCLPKYNELPKLKK